MRIALFAAPAFVLAACGGGDDGDQHSGVDPTLAITTLSGADEIALCEWSIDAHGGEGHVSHCDGFDLTNKTVEECVAQIDGWICAITVADFEACIDATEGDACRLLTEDACAIFAACE